nr:protein FAR1-related sequence 5-like [Tanacetum cinerariifolium]
IHYVKDANSDICEEIELSDGTFNYKPIVDEYEKPKVRSEYSTIDKCIEMYAKYAEKSRNITKKRKQMSHPEQIFVQQLGSTSIGATKAHHLYASTHGGYESVNATETEYQNHKRDLNAHIDPDEFEKKWHVLIEEFNLKENKWLSDMYNIGNQWIPAYFKDVELCGLMRTTSRSDSDNSFFSNFNFEGSTLINFMMCFEVEMERQRHKQEILDDSTMLKIPKSKTKLPIEQYAQKKNTKTMFILI